MSQPLESQTRGFLFADLRDYTRFVESHGDQAAAELLARYRVLVRDVIARFSGAEIRTEGDSFFVVFSSASAAVQGGLAILEAAAAAGDEPGAVAIRVGVGVHAGETADTSEGFVGSAVNLAARICALAGPGELLVSDTVRGLTRTFLAVQFVARGRRRLKGIAEPVLVYEVLPSAAVAPETGARWRPRRPGVIAASAIGLALVLLAAAALLGGVLPGGRPNPAGTSPAVTPSGASVPPSGNLGTSASTSPLLAAPEKELVAKLPAAVRQDCGPASVADGSAGGSVSLLCRLPFGAAVDEVWVDEFPSTASLEGAFSEAVARTGAPAGDCATTPRAHGAWDVTDVHAGSRLCYQEGGATWMAWTYDDDRIMVRARRGGSDWEALYAWWRQTAIFLQ